MRERERDWENVGKRRACNACVRTLVGQAVHLLQRAFAGQTDTHSQIDVIKEVNVVSQVTVDLTKRKGERKG